MNFEQVKEKVKRINHPEAREKIAEKTRDEEKIVAKDALDFIARKPSANDKAERKKIEEVVDYYKPRWRKYMRREEGRGKSFLFSFGGKRVNLSIDQKLKVMFPYKV